MTPRAIKFRAWDKYWRTMKMDPAHEPGDAQVTILNDDFFKDEYFVLMQFTGLHDKNGREIYEGDVARWYVNGVMRTGIVHWHGDACCFDLKNFHDDYHVCVDWFRGEFEVIGNIYEHPQLLETHP